MHVAIGKRMTNRKNKFLDGLSDCRLYPQDNIYYPQDNIFLTIAVWRLEPVEARDYVKKFLNRLITHRECFYLFCLR